MAYIDDKIIIEKLNQLSDNLKIDALSYIDYLIYKEHFKKEKRKNENIFDKYYGISENILDIDAQEYINKLRENDRI